MATLRTCELSNACILSCISLFVFATLPLAMRCIIFLLVSCISVAQGQQHVSALFLGNSYTFFNNLPQIIADMASTTGDTLTYASNTPGGYTLQAHSTNPASLSLIDEGSWDYVVLQEQSQLPSFPIEQVETEVFPFATLLDSLINEANTCAETVFFMTWGRKNGDALNCPVWPPVCTYEGMDDLLRERYLTMAIANEAIVSPVGALWRYLRDTAPWIELYSPDESHPSPAGSFAAACAFYTVFFREDPSLTAFPYTLDPITASTIRDAAKTVVYDSLSYRQVGNYDPVAAFDITPGTAGSVNIINTSERADTYSWDMGDASIYSEFEPVHTYALNGLYEVELIASRCNYSDTAANSVEILLTHTLAMPDESRFKTALPNYIYADISMVGTSYLEITGMGGYRQRMALQQGETELRIQVPATGVYIIQLYNNTQLLQQLKCILLSTN